MQIDPSRPTRLPARRSNLFAGLQSWGFNLPLLICLLALAVAPLWIQDAYIRRLLVASLFFGILALSFDFTGGFINAVNFGFSGFVGLGAYASAILVLNTGLSPWWGLAAAALVTALVGFLTGLLTLRLRGIYVSLMSWFVGLTLMALVSAWEDLTRGARGLLTPPIYPDAGTLSYLYILLVLFILLYAGMRAMIRSRVGLAFRAIGSNYEAARASGVNPIYYKLLNFTISCASAGLVGGLYGHFVGIVTPDIMNTGFTMEVMALSFIGGSGSLLGGVFAAFLLIPLFDSLKRLLEYRLIIYGLLLIFVMIFYPAGLSGLYDQARAWFKRRSLQN